MSDIAIPKTKIRFAKPTFPGWKRIYEYATAVTIGIFLADFIRHRYFDLAGEDVSLLSLSLLVGWFAMFARPRAWFRPPAIDAGFRSPDRTVIAFQGLVAGTALQLLFGHYGAVLLNYGYLALLCYVHLSGKIPDKEAT